MMLTRTRDEHCLSDLRLDELLAGELSMEENTDAAGHLRSCRPCRDRAAVLDRDGNSYRAAPPPLPRRRPLRRMIPAAAMAVAAAALLAVVTREPPGIRAKGSPRLGLIVNSSRAGGPDEVVRPGDTLTFTATTDVRRHVAILSRDGGGAANIYFPTGGVAEAVEPGRDVVLPLATRLDEMLGTERLYGLFCDGPVALEPLRRALAETGELPVPAGCIVDATTIEKIR